MYDVSLGRRQPREYGNSLRLLPPTHCEPVVAHDEYDEYRREMRLPTMDNIKDNVDKDNAFVLWTSLLS